MDKSRINQHLEKLRSSNTFSKSTNNKKLLNYLVDASLQGKEVKEFTIGLDVFNKSDNAGVRVYMHNLRNKLQEYYKTEGKEDDIQFELPKGRYQLLFKEVKKKSTRKKRWWIFPLVLLKAVVILFIVYKQYRAVDPLQRSVIWKDLLKNKNEALIVLGDHYFFESQINDSIKAITRLYEVNYEQQLDLFMKKHKNWPGSIKKLNYTYQTTHGAACLHKILPRFKNPLKTRLLNASELTYKDIKTNDILFFGSFKTLGKLEKIAAENGIFYKHSNGNTLVQLAPSDGIISIEPDAGCQVLIDYPVLLKTKRPYGNTIMMFMCHNDPGNIALLSYFTDEEKLKLFCKTNKITEKNRSFKTVFRVNSLGRTDMGIESLHFVGK